MLSQWDVLGVEALGFLSRLRRCWLASFFGKEVAAKQTEVSGRMRRRLTLFHLSSIFYRLCVEATWPQLSILNSQIYL